MDDQLDKLGEKRETIEINLLPFLCEAFSTNPRIYNNIDNLYKKDKYTFYRLAKNHELYNHVMAKEGSLEQEGYFKKALGIFLSDRKYEEEIYKLFIKGWNYTYVYVRNHDNFTMEEYLQSLAKKNKGLHNLGDDEINSNVLMLIKFAEVEGKNLLESHMLMGYQQNLILRMEHYKKGHKLRISHDNISKEDMQKIILLKNKIKLKYGNLEIMTDLIKDEAINKYSSIVDCIFDYENISLVSITQNTKFIDKDIEEILFLWILGYDENDVEGAAKFLVAMTRIKYFCKAYKEAKNYHFKTNQETVYIELESTQKELNKTQSILEYKLKDIEDLQDEIDRLNKENDRLRLELDKEKENKSELEALRNLMFNLDKEEDFAKEEEIDLERLKKVQAAVIGGTDNWQNNIKKVLPSFNFISYNALNFDTNLLKNIDYVFIYVNYLSHALYYKVIENAKNKMICYITVSNEKLVLQQIQGFIKNIEKDNI